MGNYSGRIVLYIFLDCGLFSPQSKLVHQLLPYLAQFTNKNREIKKLKVMSDALQTGLVSI